MQVELHAIDDFGFKGGGDVPTCAAVAIAPSSEVDLCEVGGHVLAPGFMVPYAATVRAIRGYRQDVAERIGGALHLLCFSECHPHVTLPGRAPRVYRFAVPQSGYGIGEADAGLLVRVPFSGRRQAAIVVRRLLTADLTADLTIVVRGLVYRTRAEIVFDSTVTPYVEVAAEVTVFDGSGSGWPQSNLGGTPRPLGTIVHVGGAAAPEYFDELEVWAYGVAFGGIGGEVEVSGERGL